MMPENIKLVDNSLGIVKKDSGLSSNQIKTRKTSFLSISEHWRKFRLDLLNKKLGRLKKNLVVEKYKVDSSNQLPKNLESTVFKKTEAIARLEEKIKILSKESVPSNYVRSRAIKLRNKMMSTMTYNCNDAYSVGIEQYDSVFGEDENKKNNESVENYAGNVENVFIDPAVSAAITDTSDHSVDSKENMASSEVSVDTSDKPVVPIENMASSEVDAESEEENQEELPIPDYPSALGQPVEQGMSVIPERRLTDVPLQNNASIPITSAANAPVQGDDGHITLVSPEDVADAVKSAFNDVTNPDNVVDDSSSNDFDSSSIGYPDIKDEITSSLERVRVSQNGSTEAKINQFDNNGNDVGKFDYTQMTDEEIQQSREKIEYDKYEDLYRREWEERKQGLVNSLQDIKKHAFKTTSNNTTNDVVDTYSSGMYNDTVDYTIPSGDNGNIRGDILVAPERSISVPSYVREEQFQISDAERKEPNLHMDYAGATGKDVLHAFGRESTVEGLKALKQRALKLIEENRASKKDREAARQIQVEEAERALQLRKENDQKRNEYAEMYNKLEEYCAALEEDTKAQTSSANISRNDAEWNRQFSQSMVSEMNHYDEMMGEISSILSAADDVAIDPKRR